jgi:hypothetical protein
VYFDVKVEGERVGRIVVALLDDVKVGAQRFADLAEEKEGVGYRLSKFDGIFPVSHQGGCLESRNCVQHRARRCRCVQPVAVSVEARCVGVGGP